MRALLPILVVLNVLSACAPIEMTDAGKADALVTASPGGESRASICSWTASRVDGKCVNQQVCKPYIADGQGPAMAAAAPAAALPPAQAARAAQPSPRIAIVEPKCPVLAPMQIIQKQSRNCWISDRQYCVKPSLGQTGYACSCRTLSGYYG
jgi:hypothetical protein